MLGLSSLLKKHCTLSHYSVELLINLGFEGSYILLASELRL